MDFWKTDDSSFWQDDSLSTQLHESLFKTANAMLLVKKQQKAKKRLHVQCSENTSKHRAESKCEKMRNTQPGNCHDGVARKRKKKQELSTKSGENLSADSPSDIEKSVQTNDATKLQPHQEEKKRQVIKGSTESTEQSEKAKLKDEQSDGVSKNKKKRKRKAKKNKFKDSFTCEKEEEEEEEGKKVSSEMNKEEVKLGVNGTEYCSGMAEPSPNRKERRKLQRKMAKQQMKAEKNMSKEKMTTKFTCDLSTSHYKQTCKEREEDGKSNAHLWNDSTPDIILASSKKKSLAKPESLKHQMESQLKSSHFRFINEQLYKVTGEKAKEMFADDGAAFRTYHEGFTQQVQQWPTNPVDVIIEALKKRPATMIVGDFGCGDAKIARSVRQKVHSFDLYPINKHVTVCDIKKVPLKDCILDIAIFCLSLMGTNWMEFVLESNRVLKIGGLLKVAEVASRFTSLASFLTIMKTLGFQLKSKDMSNKMFYLFDFKKKQVVSTLPTMRGPILKPCLYKKR